MGTISANRFQWPQLVYDVDTGTGWKTGRVGLKNTLVLMALVEDKKMATEFVRVVYDYVLHVGTFCPCLHNEQQHFGAMGVLN
jgi:hypothetical protein